jgi:four helix bundle protein
MVNTELNKLEAQKQSRRDLPERSFNFAREIMNLCLILEKSPGASRILAAQLLRSGTSVGANVEEAQAGQSRADFLSKMSIACKEARETHYWLRLLGASQLIPDSKLAALLDEANQLVAITTAIIRKTKENAAA